jgi:hypothetical protein
MIATDDDDDHVEEETIMPQDDNESAISMKHNLDPVMETLRWPTSNGTATVGKPVIASHNWNLYSLLVFYM